MNQVKQFIKFLHSGKQGCFNDTYPGFQKAFTDNGWRKLDFGKENDLLRKKTKKNKFGIGKSGQLFRLAGIQNNGFYIIMRFFKHAHSTHDYDEYVSKDVKDLDKTAFKKITKTLW